MKLEKRTISINQQTDQLRLAYLLLTIW